MKRHLLVAGILAAVMSTPALAQSASAPRACLRFGEIYSWSALDDRTVIVEDNRHDKFRLALMGHCPDLQFKERIAFKSPGSTYLSCMSAGDTLLVNQFSTRMPQRCPIVGITAYTPEMERVDKAAKATAGVQ